MRQLKQMIGDLFKFVQLWLAEMDLNLESLDLETGS